MTRKKINIDDECNLLINCLIHTDYAKEIIPIVNEDRKVLSVSYTKVIWNWLNDFFNQYNLSPTHEVFDIWFNKRGKFESDEDIENDAVTLFLQKLNERYENSSEINIQFEIDQTIQYINDKRTEQLKDFIDNPDTDTEAKVEAISKFKVATRNTSKEIYSFIDDIELTPPDWLLKGFLLKNSLNMIFGDPNTAKTFAALDFGLSIASGIDYHTHRLCASGPVLYWAGEGVNTIKRRVTAWKIAHEVKERIPFFVLNNNIALVDYRTLIPIENALKEIDEKYGTPQLLIFDTWARALGEDENATKQANLAVKNLDKLRSFFGTSIYIVHHCGLNEKDRGRGSSAVNGAADNIYKCTQDASKIVRIISTKSKDFENIDKMQFKLVDYDLGILDEHKRQITSAALHMVNYEPIKKVRRYGKNEKLAIETLNELRGDNNSISIKIWRSALLETGMKMSIYNQTLNRLLENGDIYRKDLLISPFSF